MAGGFLSEEGWSDRKALTGRVAANRPSAGMEGALMGPLHSSHRPAVRKGRRALDKSLPGHHEKSWETDMEQGQRTQNRQRSSFSKKKVNSRVESSNLHAGPDLVTPGS